MAKVEINGTGGEVDVTPEQALLTTSTTFPPFGRHLADIYRQYMTTDGTTTGSNDMGIDGSVTPVDFFISADEKEDRYITNINLIVGYGTSGSPSNWADGVALTNGIRFFYESERGEKEIHDGIKTNQDMFRLSHYPIDAAWEVRGVNATNDYGYFITIHLDNFMPPFGIKLDAGSNQRLVMCVRDNVGATADTLNAIAYGFDRFI